MLSFNPVDYDKLRGISFCVWRKSLRHVGTYWEEREISMCMCREDKSRCVHYWPLDMHDPLLCAFWCFDGVSTCTHEEAAKESKLEYKIEEL